MLPIITLEDQVPMVQIGHRQLTQICALWPSGIESTKGSKFCSQPAVITRWENEEKSIYLISYKHTIMKNEEKWFCVSGVLFPLEMSSAGLTLLYPKYFQQWLETYPGIILIKVIFTVGLEQSDNGDSMNNLFVCTVSIYSGVSINHTVSHGARVWSISLDWAKWPYSEDLTLRQFSKMKLVSWSHLWEVDLCLSWH